METSIKELTLPSGKKVVMNEISAGQFLDATDTPDDKELSKREIAKRIMNIAVASIDGVSEDIASVLRALSLPDYIFLSKEVTKLITGDFTEAKNP
jgi:hypothetical protein